MRAFLVVLSLVAVVLGGCAQTAQKAVEQTTGTQIDQKGDSVTVKGKDGTAVTFSSTTPEELKNFPVPSGFKFESSGSMASGEDKLSVGTWKGKASLADVGTFYKSTATSQGWTTGLTFEDANGGQLHATAKEGMSYIVTYSKQDGGEVEVSVMAAKEKPKTPTATREAATPTREPTATTPAKAQPSPTASGPVTVDASALPQEMKAIVTLPSGFGVIKDSPFRIQNGDKVGATAGLFGKGDLAAIQAQFQKALTDKGFTEQAVITETDQVIMMYAKEDGDKTINVGVSIEKKDTGLEVLLQYQSE